MQTSGNVWKDVSHEPNLRERNYGVEHCVTIPCTRMHVIRAGMHAEVPTSAPRMAMARYMVAYGAGYAVPGTPTGKAL